MDNILSNFKYDDGAHEVQVTLAQETHGQPKILGVTTIVCLYSRAPVQFPACLWEGLDGSVVAPCLAHLLAGHDGGLSVCCGFESASCEHLLRLDMAASKEAGAVDEWRVCQRAIDPCGSRKL